VAAVETDAVLSLLQEVAEEVINPRFRSLAQGQVREKNPGDLVTIADHEAEVLIARALRAAYPEAVILGEEDYAKDRSVLQAFTAAPHAFTIDPVDGTKNFVHGKPDHAVMVAELRDGLPVRGWIWQPQHEHAYVAERGGGAWRDGERLHRTAPQGGPGRLRGVTSRRRFVGRQLAEQLPAMELSWVCCGIDYPKLVEGATDYIVYGSVMPWDHSAGSLLVAEAGGHTGTWDGGTYRPPDVPKGLVAAADRATYELVQPLLD
jgi:fructose-1,6-bisphosphatase/inositol monophosphatase family enzyme